MYFFYVDESGSPEGHHLPLLNGETPIFSLNSLCIRDNNWRDLDREYLKLKNRFFRNEIGARRPEYYEIKGSELTRPGNRTNRRAHQFIKQIISLCAKFNGTLFSIIFIKDAVKPTSKKSYTAIMREMCPDSFFYLVSLNRSWFDPPAPRLRRVGSPNMSAFLRFVSIDLS